ncbi:hypothetical protein K2173_000712 [Erythroxylum novogranatense]|uniref:Longin domain-containing protein n=1 Tax=Erythroxylum novogranatense TaxID=1862640 RepID=A0AAV8SJ05_9ROSI|nr:hypothetical protein K2173_000712 [Erythroxylum novogranatense]
MKIPPMISNPSLFFYACIAKGPTILAQFPSSKEPGIETIAQKCVEETPSYHSMFCHTFRRKTYTFLINDPFAFFAIFDQEMDRFETLCFLNSVKNSFEELMESNPIKDFDELVPLCLQGTFHPIFREIIALDLDLSNSLVDSSTEYRNPSVDSTRGKRTIMKPLLPKPGKMLMKKKKRLFSGFADVVGDPHHKDAGSDEKNNKVNNMAENGNGAVSKEFPLSMMQKSGGSYLVESKQKAKQIWKKHVWVVLILDLVVCAVLFGIWLWVCRGFKCIDG